MTAIPTQAQIVRVIKATVQGFQAATGRVATATKVTFRAGEPIVEVTASEESPPSPAKGGVNVQDFQQALKAKHAARRS